MIADIGCFSWEQDLRMFFLGACDAPEGKGCHRKRGKMQKRGAGNTKAKPPTSCFPSAVYDYDQTRGGKVSETSQNYQSFWKMNKCHSLMFWKDIHVELAQELSRTQSLLCTRVIAPFNLSIMLGDMPHLPQFLDEKTEMYRTNKWVNWSLHLGCLMHKWMHFLAPPCPPGW